MTAAASPSSNAPAANSGKNDDAGTRATSMGPADAGARDAAVSGVDASSMQQAMPSSDALVRPDDSECEYIEIHARNDANTGEPAQVDTGDFLKCFLMDAGFDSPTQAFGFSPLIDNADVVSDMVLRTIERSDNRGPIITCDESWPTHQAVAFWVPGADDWYYPKDMGIELGRGLFILEVHYSNPGAATSDRSGMRICTSKKLRPRTASMSWLGNQSFGVPGGAKDYAVTGRCVPVNQTEPIHILRVLPVMNALGKRAAMQIDHIDGTTQIMFDEPFDYRERKTYDTAATVRVGDSVLSTCVYDNPKPTTVRIGVRDSDELCHMLVLAYPPRVLVDNAWSIEHNSCAGQ